MKRIIYTAITAVLLCSTSVFAQSSSSSDKIVYVVDGAVVTVQEFASMSPSSIKKVKVIKKKTNSKFKKYANDDTETVMVIKKRSKRAIDSQSNDDVNIGYGAQERDKVDGAVSGGTVKDKKKRTYTDMYDYLNGRAGLMVSGQGANASITIRGVGTNSNQTQPLILVNGIEVSTLSNINPDDVTSIEVIKDGTSSIYGMRGANGVVLITTQGGQK